MCKLLCTRRKKKSTPPKIPYSQNAIALTSKVPSQIIIQNPTIVIPPEQSVPHHAKSGLQQAATHSIHLENNPTNTDCKPAENQNSVTYKPTLLNKNIYISHSLIMGMNDSLQDECNLLRTDQSPERNDHNIHEIWELLRFKEEYERKEKEIANKNLEQRKITEEENKLQTDSAMKEDMIDECENISIEKDRKNIPENSITKINFSKIVLQSTEDTKEKNIPPISYRSDASTNKMEDILKLFDNHPKIEKEVSPQSSEDELHSLLATLNVYK